MLGGKSLSAGGQTRSPSSFTSYSREEPGSRSVRQTSAYWCPSMLKVVVRRPSTSTSHGPSVSTQTDASVWLT